jgi:hypothetical protein
MLVMVTGVVLLLVKTTKFPLLGLLLLTVLKSIAVPSATAPKLIGLGEALMPPATTFPVRPVEVEPETPFPRLAVTETLAV